MSAMSTAARNPELTENPRATYQDVLDAPANRVAEGARSPRAQRLEWVHRIGTPAYLQELRAVATSGVKKATAGLFLGNCHGEDIRRL